MKFLLDQDVYASTAWFLSGLGNDVVLVAKQGYLFSHVALNPERYAPGTWQGLERTF